MFRLLLALSAILWIADSRAATNVLFSTGFEVDEGYDANLALVGQNGWQGLNSGSFDNGLVEGFIAGKGQHAYLGFIAPSSRTNVLLLWQPLNIAPPSNSLVRFSVLMQVRDSTNNAYDDFQWSVYNRAGELLFSVDFDNNDNGIYYGLDGTNDFIYTGHKFTNDITREFSVAIDFAANRWNAWFGGRQIVTNKAVTTIGSARDLGDIDAVWFIRNATKPGDNFLVFDDFKVSLEMPNPPVPDPAARLAFVGRLPGGTAVLRLDGPAGRRFAIDATTNFLSWKALRTNTLDSGSLEFTDSESAVLPRRFYRARRVP